MLHHVVQALENHLAEPHNALQVMTDVKNGKNANVLKEVPGDEAMIVETICARLGKSV